MRCRVRTMMRVDRWGYSLIFYLLIALIIRVGS